MGIFDRFKKQIPGALKATPVVAGTKQPEPATPALAAPSETTVPAAAPALSWGQAGAVVIRPLVTEKSSQQQSANQYAFLVAPEANKAAIAIAIRQLYGVRPTKVNVVNVQGKRLRFGAGQGRRSDFKKAIVTLPAGASIQVHEGV